MSNINGDSPIPASVHQAVKSLFNALGTPVPDRNWVSSGEENAWGCHPVFSLAEHYRGHDNGDRGYTDNPYRGDHMSIPCFTEDGTVFALDISFHKGDMHMERINYPDGPPAIRKALFDLLESCETR